jgi:hypothetical protein
VSEDKKICPACGKPTTGYVPCPHCGADPRLRLSIRVAVLLCVVILVLGSGFFVLHLSTARVGPTPIGSIDRWMDYASVWIKGTVISGPQIGKASISFEVQDESGVLNVEIYLPSERLKRENKIPSVGDSVLLFGQLRVHPDGRTEIRVSSLGKDPLTGEEYFQLTRAQLVETSIGYLVSDWYASQSLKYKRVTIEGTITNLWPLSSAKLYTLEDNNGATVEMYVHNGLSYIENVPDLEVLQTVRVTAGVSEYRAKLQLALSSYDDIEVVGAWSPNEVGIENINDNLDGKFVKVMGQIVFVEMVGKSGSLEVDKRYLWLGDNDNPRILMYERIYNLLPENLRKMLRRGARAELVGRVSKPAGQFQIEFTSPQEPILENGTYEPALIENVATINSSLLNDFVTIQGRIIENSKVRRGTLPSDWEFVLRDNLGESCKIWIPNTIYERMLNPITVGDNVCVVGKVIYRAGGISVQPGVPDDVVKVS